MKTHNAIDRFGLALNNLNKLQLGAPLSIQHVRNQIKSEIGLVGAVPKQENLDEVFGRFLHASNRNEFENISNRDWRIFPWVAWREEGILASQNNLWDRYLTYLQSGSSRSIRTLIHVLLRDDPPSSPKIEKTLGLIQESIHNSENKTLQIWAERENKYLLFHQESRYKNLAQVIIKSDEPIEEILENCGLIGELENGKFSQKVYLVGLKLDLVQLKIIDGLTRILEWSIKEDNLRYPSLKGKLADRLLLNLQWQNDKDSKIKIRDFLLKHLNDPRTYPGNWQDVSHNAKEVMFSWMVDVALEQFFSILDKSALDRHWKYRREFWRAYFKKNVLRDAWLAVGRDARQVVPLILEDQRIASLDPPNIQHNQSVLIMTIGDLVIAEWSHNGSCRIWLNNNQYAPKLYDWKYNRITLSQHPDLEQAHHGSDHNYWQKKVAHFIENHTGIESPI